MPRRVRIVEDHEDIAVMLAAMLTVDVEGLPLDVVATIDGFATLLAPGPWDGVDVAVCDLMLGEVSGLDILRYLRDEHPQIRRVAITAALTAAAEATGVAHRVLTKPFYVADVLEAIA